MTQGDDGPIRLTPSSAAGDALLIIDVQNDFLPGGALAVLQGDQVVPVLNRYLNLFVAHGLPVVVSRDAHPPDHCSFDSRGGIWPVHCVLGTPGTDFAPGLHLPPDFILVSKATTPDDDAYSAFTNTGLDARLHELKIRRLWVGGLATDYCIRATVLDARAEGFEVLLLIDAVRPVELRPGDGDLAVQDMVRAGAIQARWIGSDVCHL